MFNRQLNTFLPSIYSDIVEMQDIMNAEEQEMDIVRREMSSAFANTFVLTSDASGVIMFEKMLNIVANVQTEDLEFRKQRILNRMATSPPFTFKFLESKLNEIIGVGAWTAHVDFNNYTLYIESSASNQNWYSEIEFTINRVKPCNMVFVNVPLTTVGMMLSEEVSYSTLNWKYRLGSWKLGHQPFATTDGGGVIKMPEIRSVKPALLGDAAQFVASDIASVLINDTIEITAFKAKSVSDNVVSIEYEVIPSMTNLITGIKLRNAEGRTLTESVVYVPVTQTVVSKHLVTVKEGV